MSTAAASPAHRVMRDGVLLHDRAPGQRIAFEVAARNRWFDLQPFSPPIAARPAPAMVDADLILEKLAFVETCVEDLRRLARPALIETDLREERFVVHTLQLAIQAARDADAR